MAQHDAIDDGAHQPLLAAAADDDGREDYFSTTAQYAPSSSEPATSAAAAESGAGGNSTFSRNLGTVEAFAILISIVIGSGIFTSPGSIDTNVPSPGAALVVWLVGGILAWTGATTMAELGTAIPGEGQSVSRF